MNVNEVIASLASRALGGGLGAARRVHPNDDVNLGPVVERRVPDRDARGRGAADAAAAGVAGAAARRVAGQGRGLCRHAQGRPHASAGRHAGHASARSSAATTRSSRSPKPRCASALPAVHALAIGGTAVGTGLNTHREFGARVAAVLAARLGAPFVVAANLFAAMAGHEPLVGLHGALQHPGRGAEQDRQRHPPDGQRPARRPGRTATAGERARQFDHAGQGQPDAGRGADDGLRPGDGTRRGDRHRGQPGPLRAQRLQAADRLRRARQPAPAGRRDGQLRRRTASRASRSTRARAGAC